MAGCCFVFAPDSLCEIRQSIVPQLAAKGSQAAKSKSTTTISHTFAEYNTVITIYVIGPVSLLFLFRMMLYSEDTRVHGRRIDAKGPGLAPGEYIKVYAVV